MKKEEKDISFSEPLGIPSSFLRYALKSGNSIIITIPKEFVELEGIREGDLLKVYMKKVYEK